MIFLIIYFVCKKNNNNKKHRPRTHAHMSELLHQNATTWVGKITKYVLVTVKPSPSDKHYFSNKDTGHGAPIV